MPSKPLLPPITPKQKIVIGFIYRFRFLTRKQLQKMLGLKDAHRINSWLKDLRDKDYVAYRQFDSYLPHMEPFRYYLLPLSRYQLKHLSPHQCLALRRRLERESSRSDRFVIRSQILADLYLYFHKLPNVYKHITMLTQCELPPHFPSRTALPHAYLRLDPASGKRANPHRYLVYVIDHHTNRRKVVNLLTAVGDLNDSGDWEDYAQHPFPRIMVIVPDRQYLSYVTRVVLALREEQPQPMNCFLAKATDLVHAAAPLSIWRQVA